MEHRPDRPYDRVNMPAPSRWTLIVDWLGAQGPVNLSLYSCSISAAIGIGLALLR